MEKVIKCGVLLLVLVSLSVALSHATVCSRSVADGMGSYRTEGRIYRGAFFICEHNAPDLTVGFSYFSSSMKFCSGRVCGGCNSASDFRSAFPLPDSPDFFSFPDPRAYYVLGLRKIVV